MFTIAAVTCGMTDISRPIWLMKSFLKASSLASQNDMAPALRVRDLRKTRDVTHSSDVRGVTNESRTRLWVCAQRCSQRAWGHAQR